jgi:hypothetical protein
MVQGRKETIQECVCGSQTWEWAEDERGFQGYFCTRCFREEGAARKLRKAESLRPTNATRALRKCG